MFVGVAGLIGVGKSTLTTNLAGELGRRAQIAKHDHPDRQQPYPDNLARHDSSILWGARYEPVEENPYLVDFYADIPRWTFNMQMFLLAARFEQHQEVLWDKRHRIGGGVVQDRTIYEDTIFARMHREDGLMSDRDWATYINHFHIMQGFLRYPDIILYLRVTPDVAMSRIKERGREAEGGMEMSYLERLFEGYEEFAEEMQRYTVVIPLDWNDYEPVGQVADKVADAAKREQKFLRSLRRI